MEYSATEEENICVRVFISGLVQLVGYRVSTVHQARKLGVNGWVRNLSDGRVEAVFEGDKAAVEQMVKWCRNGPSTAVVRNVTIEPLKVTGIESFEIIH